jgi:hypothetical protein
MKAVRIRIVSGCLVRGEPCDPGEVLEVDVETAHELMSCARAEFADDAVAARYRGVPIIAWRDTDPEASRLLKRIA